MSLHQVINPVKKTNLCTGGLQVGPPNHPWWNLNVIPVNTQCGPSYYLVALVFADWAATLVTTCGTSAVDCR
jgi:hypothetical protein